VDEIIARAPINRQAAEVTGPGTHFDPKKKIQTKDSDTPIPVRSPLASEKSNPCFKDLAGIRFGRFVVLGIFADSKPGIGLRWVVKCSCGVYSVRAGKAIKNPENTQDRCEHCRYLAYLKRNECWRRTGRQPDIRDF